MKKSFALLALIALTPYALATDININNCTTLNVEGATYTLTSDIPDSSAMECLSILANNVTLDCNRHTIRGMNLSDSNGIIVNGASGANVKNCKTTNWYYGVVSTRGSNNAFTNITSSSSKMWGLVFDAGKNITLRNALITGSGSYAFLALNSSGGFIHNISITYCKSFGFDLWNSSDNIISGVYAHDNTGDAHGIILDNSHNNSLGEIETYRNHENGIYLYYSDNNTLTNGSTRANNLSGVVLYNSRGNVLDNITSDGNKVTGVWVDESDENTIKNSRITGNTYTGIIIDDSSDNAVYNNYFSNAAGNGMLENAQGTNSFNSSKTTGNRVYSQGNEIGGNYWSAPEQNGYSDTCTDVNANGFCDQEYALADGNVDRLPLSDKYQTTTTSSTTSTTQGACELTGDEPPCGEINISEIVTIINKWVAGQATIPEVVALINAWATAT
ncbi:MAG: NosD domain-containing protein [Candidatus Altiarchaeia archaeon]